MMMTPKDPLSFKFADVECSSSKISDVEFSWGKSAGKTVRHA